MASLNVGNLGEYLREQRRAAQLSLRQLADATGVSNPYLSQIERGLRKPSADVLQQVAKALRISAETLYVRAGILDEREREELETRAVILADPSINERQKSVLLQIYDSFRRENGYAPAPGTEADAEVGSDTKAGTDAEAGAVTEADADIEAGADAEAAPGTHGGPHVQAGPDADAGKDHDPHS
ncbi:MULTISPECIES: helix-turn-helix domain-containing protein [Streptomyces]|uniref:helix-turn-helix domain-containing protein n=1 Tax=Streptomyces TaxID=1883 RepID=UPI0005BE57D9|nr:MULTISPECIES: helix-turn-helix transcriptional regulator [Streptomyces]MDP9950983.1 transcriptional regulator with XRE-family HTH domain [Streptomyces sp. DSM 41269]